MDVPFCGSGSRVSGVLWYGHARTFCLQAPHCCAIYWATVFRGAKDTSEKQSQKHVQYDTVCSMPFPERTLHPLPGCRSASRQSWLFASYMKHGVQSFKFVQDISRPSSHAALALKCGTCGVDSRWLKGNILEDVAARWTLVKHEPSACCTYEFVGPILKRMLTKRTF